MSSLSDRANPDTMIKVGLIVSLTLFVLGLVIRRAINYERQTTHYPGATLIQRHNTYSPASRTILWDDIYLTTDTLWEIQQWYSQRFEVSLDLASHTMKDGCMFLRDTKNHYLLERRISVALCETSNGQTISVTRSASLE